MCLIGKTQLLCNTQAQAVLSHALCGAPVTGAGCVCVSYQLPLAATPRFSILTE